MNVTTSTTASTSDVSSTRSSSRTDNSSKTSEKSFDEEMKVQETSENAEENKVSDLQKDNQKTEKDSTKEADNLVRELQDEEELVTKEMLSGAVNFTDFKYNNESQSLLSQNIQNLLNTKDLISTVNSAITVDYDAINMSDNDADFFVNLVQNSDMSMKNIISEFSETNNAQTAQSIQVSSVLMEKLADSLRTNQPFRIDFDKDVSVIIKVNRDGSLSANFIPGDKAVEQYLRNNISFLKQRFDEENLSYSELSYSNSRNHQQQQKRKKENDNE